MKNPCLKFLLFAISIIFVSPSIAQDKPLLSTAIKDALENKSIDETKKLFQDVTSLREKYQVDPQGVIQLAGSYGQTGDAEKARAALEIGTPFFQYSGDPSTLPPELTSKPKPPTKPTAPEPVVEKTKPDPAPRSDLDRFSGIYAQSEGSRRYITVLPTCDGKYLLFNPSWGDAVGFYCESIGDLTFTTSDSQSQLTINFEVNEDGSGKRITHDFSYIDNPLDFQRPLPEGEEPCKSVIR